MGSLAWAFVADTKFIKRVFPTPPWMPAAFQKKEFFLNPINGKREVSTRWTFKNAKFKHVDIEEFPEKFFPDEFVENLDRHVSGGKMDGCDRDVE